MGIAEGRIKRQKHEPPYNHVIGSDVNRFLKLWHVPNKFEWQKSAMKATQQGWMLSTN